MNKPRPSTTLPIYPIESFREADITEDNLYAWFRVLLGEARTLVDLAARLMDDIEGMTEASAHAASAAHSSIDAMESAELDWYDRKHEDPT